MCSPPTAPGCSRRWCSAATACFGSGSVIPDLQAELFRAVKADDLAEASGSNDRIYPLARVFYADPWADMHNRMKEALVLLGRLSARCAAAGEARPHRDRPHPRGAGRIRPPRNESEPRRGVSSGGAAPSTSSACDVAQRSGERAIERPAGDQRQPPAVGMRIDAGGVPRTTDVPVTRSAPRPSRRVTRISPPVATSPRKAKSSVAWPE